MSPLIPTAVDVLVGVAIVATPVAVVAALVALAVRRLTRRSAPHA